eukprot:6345175-Amphidinium_carterae.1
MAELLTRPRLKDSKFGGIAKYVSSTTQCPHNQGMKLQGNKFMAAFACRNCPARWHRNPGETFSLDA